MARNSTFRNRGNGLSRGKSKLTVRSEREKDARDARLADRPTLHLPRPGQIEHPRWLKVFADGREWIDPHHPAGAHEWGIREEQVKRRDTINGVLFCQICFEPILRPEHYVTDHIISKGHGGRKHDDRVGNLQAAHNFCNLEKGSRDGWTKLPRPEWAAKPCPVKGGERG